MMRVNPPYTFATQKVLHAVFLYNYHLLLLDKIPVAYVHNCQHFKYYYCDENISNISSYCINHYDFKVFIMSNTDFR